MRKFNTSDIQHLFGRTIRYKRVEAGISQEYLAYLSGVDRSFMGKIERGQRQVSITTLVKICIALQILPSELAKQSLDEFCHDERKTQKEEGQGET